MRPPRRAAALLGRLVPRDPGQALRRFPASCAAAAAGTLVVVLGLYDVLGEPFVERALPGLIAYALAALSVDLVAEGRSWPARRRLVGQLGVAAWLALTHSVDGSWRATDVVLIPGLILAVAVAPFVRRGASAETFWRFNTRVWLAAGLALGATAAFAVGIFAIDRSLDILFGIDFEEVVQNVVFPVAFCLLAPLAWLSAIPDPTSQDTLAPEPFVDRAAGLLARFIVVPLLLTYAVILLAYALQIAVTGEMPQGQVGWMVSAFGTAGALATLMLHPERQAGGAVRFFLRWWYAITVVPILLLALAVYQRVAAYGVTPDRYGLALCALWLAALAALFAWRRPADRDIRLVPAIAAVLMILASFGPWGALAVSARSQADQFVALAEAQGWLREGRLDPAPLAAPPPQGSPRVASERASHILGYLAELEALPALEARLANPDALAAIAGRDPYLRRAMAEQLDLAPGALPAQPRAIELAPAGTAFDIAGFAAAHGPFRLSAGQAPAPGAPVAGRIEGGTVLLTLPQAGEIALDLAPLVTTEGGPDAPVRLAPFHLVAQPGGGSVGLLVTEVSGLMTEAGLELHQVAVLVLTP